MFVVNPRYKPPLMTVQEKEKVRNMLQSILLIPPSERFNQDKKFVYEYFISNQYLREIERSKSLRARILSVGEIQLITKEAYFKNKENILKNKQKAQQFDLQKEKQCIKADKSNQTSFQHPCKTYTILQSFRQNSTLAVLNHQTVEQILLQPQQPIRQAMLLLKSFTFLKIFDYHQQLYLAHFIKPQSQSQTNYKQFIFLQNQPTKYVYLIEEGEFQVFKNLQFTKDKSLSKINDKKHISLMNKYMGLEESPYKSKQVKIVKQELAKIEGGAGQSFGEVELILKKQTRLYSFKCNSLTSRVIKIAYKHFQEIFKYNQHLFEKLEKQYKLKHQSDLLKTVGNKYSKDGVISIEPKTPNYGKTIDLLSSNKLSEIIFSMEKYKTLDTSRVQGAYTLPNNSMSIPVNQHAAKKNAKRQKKIYSENALNSVKSRYKLGFDSEIRTSTLEFSNSVSLNEPSFEVPFFPVISKNLRQKKQEHNNGSLPSLMVAKRRHKVKGLIDIQTIIRDKQELYNSKITVQNPEFSFYKLDQKHQKLINFRKPKPKDLSVDKKSAAHSKQYMKNLLKQSLKKSGYLPQNVLLNYENNMSLHEISKTRTQQLVNTSSFSIRVSEEDNKSRPDQTHDPSLYVLSRQQRASLVSNQFDHFFHKI